MPNTPALVGEGMTGVAYDKDEFSFEEREVIDSFFNSFGKVVYVAESQMNAIVCASGSSPAYVYMFIEALADSAVKYGIREMMHISLLRRQYLVLPRWCLKQVSIQACLRIRCAPRAVQQ